MILLRELSRKIISPRKSGVIDNLRTQYALEAIGKLLYRHSPTGDCSHAFGGNRGNHLPFEIGKD